MECTDNEYCEMLLILGTCNSWAGSAAWEYMPQYWQKFVMEMSYGTGFDKAKFCLQCYESTYTPYMG
jgi:hypothetical protein